MTDDLPSDRRAVSRDTTDDTDAGPRQSGRYGLADRMEKLRAEKLRNRAAQAERRTPAEEAEDDAPPRAGGAEAKAEKARDAEAPRKPPQPVAAPEPAPEPAPESEPAPGAGRQKGKQRPASAPAAAARAAAAEPAAPQEGEVSPGLSPVPGARLRVRHVVAIASFVIVVILPVVASAWYLWTRAHDRYVSYAGFSVRTEEVGSAFELLGGVAELSGSSSSDTDILYKFIQSPELVAKVDAQLDLREIWSRPGHDWSDPGDDPVFAYNPGSVAWGLLGSGSGRGTIEDLTDYWSRMVNVYSDSGTGLIDLEVQAFTPEEAEAITRMIYDESSKMINRLSAIAREDATRYAREELDQSVERLKTARETLTRFRNENQIVDPEASIQSQMGLLSSLQAQLAQTLIDLDILRQTAPPNDPRIAQAERMMDVIEKRIAEERRKLGIGAGASPEAEAEAGDNVFANLVGDYERLAVDRQFAEQSYTAALTAYDSALAEAQRQSRYLAAHVNPTRPEAAVEPDRPKLLSLIALFAFLSWAIAVLAAYALRDRR